MQHQELCPPEVIVPPAAPVTCCQPVGLCLWCGGKTSRAGPQSEKYLDQIMVFRFYFRCSKCGAEMSMKTDPKNSDYVMEQGATRNYEPWREKDRVRLP